MTSLADAFHQLAVGLGMEDRALALLLLVVVAVVAHLLLGVLVRHLSRVADATSHNWDDVVLAALARPVRVVLWVVVAYLALEIYPVAEGLRAWALGAYDTALVLALAWFFQRLIAGVSDELLRERQDASASTDRATVLAVAKLSRVVLWVSAGLMVLQSLGVSISGLLAFGGIGGIAVGFAAKDLLANFFGGLSIYLDRPFSVGDWIRSPDKSIEGTVEDIGWRLTRIRTFDQRPLYVPNSSFLQISVENPSRMRNRRIYETIGLRYQDAAKMADVVAQVQAMLRNHPEIDLGRTLIVNFVAYGPSSLDFFVYAFTRTTDWVTYHAIKQDVLLKILDIIHANGADVAFPTQTLHVEQVVPEEMS